MKEKTAWLNAAFLSGIVQSVAADLKLMKPARGGVDSVPISVVVKSKPYRSTGPYISNDCKEVSL